MDIRMNIHDLGYDYAIKYLNQQQDVGINHVAQALGYHGISYDGIISNLESEKKSLSAKYEISEVLLDELGTQGSEGHDQVYGSYYYTIESQTAFTAYLELCQDMQKLYPNIITNLGISGGNYSAGNVECSTGPMKLGGLAFNGSRITIKGDAEIHSISKMKDEDDLLRVEGNLTVGAQSYSDPAADMTAGTVELCGDLTFYNYPYYNGGYNPQGTCKTVFCGEEMQNVLKTYSDRDVEESPLNLGNVEIQCPDLNMSNLYSEKTLKLKLLSDTKLGETSKIVCGYLDLNGYQLETGGSVRVNSVLDMTGQQKTIKCNTLSVETLILKGETKPLECNTFSAKKIALTGGAGEINSGKSNVDQLSYEKGRLTIKGDAEIHSISKMKDEDDLLRVEGNLTVGAQSYSDPAAET